MPPYISNKSKFSKSFLFLTQGYRYHKLRKTFGNFSGHTLTCCLKVKYRFKNMLRKESLTRVFYGDLVYKLRRVRCEANFVSSGSKIVKRLRRRKYDSLIIERTIGLVLGPSTALYRSFLEHCTLTNKAVGLHVYEGTCPNLLRGDKAPILVPSDC